MRPAIKIILVSVLIAAAAVGGWFYSREPESTDSLPPPTMLTPHYAISSTADETQTKRVAAAVESLHAAYAEFFARKDIDSSGKKLLLVLYRDRAEFKLNNRSASWAEAYYSPPACHAYYDENAANPYHWMIHEATHQLNREISGFERRRWSDEGLAAYFATSQLRDGKLLLGELDRDTYPLWWLPKMKLTGDRREDIGSGRIIALRYLLTDTGPPIVKHVNLYYIEYWSLVHYLLHRNGGRDAPAFKALMAEGASVDNFEKRFGPVETVEAGWYEHLRSLIPTAPSAAPPPENDGAVSVEIGT